MQFYDQAYTECNVRVSVVDEKGNIKSQQTLKNTATKRMTTGLALFVAGDGDTYHQGKWRPNFISFGTTGIDKQPTTANGKATVNDEKAFSNKHPEEGVRTRPWFYSVNLGERGMGFWDQQYGWGTKEHPNEPVFQGELVTKTETDEAKIIHRLPLLRADVATDYKFENDTARETFSTDCILYGYASVLWCNQFFNPIHGPSVPRIAISEVGLFEQDSFPAVGLDTLMAGFRVPDVAHIIYVDPGEVILVEWRVTVRALMPYEVIGE